MANAKNLSAGTLYESISASTTILLVYVGDGGASTIKAVWPTAPFYATIMPANPVAGVANSMDSEIVLVNSVSNDQVGNTALSVTRAQKGTTAKAFDAGAVVLNGIYVGDTSVGVWRLLGKATATNATSATVTFDADYDMYEVFADSQCASETWCDIRVLKPDSSEQTGVTRTELSVSGSSITGGTYAGTPIATCPALAYSEATIRVTSTNGYRNHWRAFEYSAGCKSSYRTGSSGLGGNTEIRGFRIVCGANMLKGNIVVFGRNINE